jgi:hypothetical protein
MGILRLRNLPSVIFSRVFSDIENAKLLRASSCHHFISLVIFYFYLICAVPVNACAIALWSHFA